MDLSPSDEQVMIRDMVRRFLADRYDGTSMAKGPMAPEDWHALGELGVFSLLLPEASGGIGGGPVEIMVVAEELGRALAITPLAESVVLCGHLIDIQMAEKLARGDAFPAFARGGVVDEGKISGSVGLVRNGIAASAFVLATADGGVVIVQADGPGVERRAVRMVDGSIAADLHFTGAPATPVDCSAEDLARATALCQLAIVAELVGAMATLLDLTVDYVQQRQQFGKQIASFQVIQHRCARLFTLLEQARSMMTKAALVEDNDRARAVTAALAYVGDAALRLAEDAVQLHGGMGVTDELVVGRGLRRILLLSRLFGGGMAARGALAA